MFSAIIIVTENQRALLIWDCADISSGSVPSQSYNTLGINPEDLDLLSRTVLRLGGYVEGLFDLHDFGFDKNSLKDHISSVHATLKRLKENAPPEGIPLRPPNIPPGAFWEDQGEVWNYLQTLRFAAGATMMTEQYLPHMTPDNLQRAMTAKIFRECVIGILDDLIDKGNYSYLEAKDLHHMVLSSMLDPDFDSTSFTKRLVTMLRQEQIPLFDLINNFMAGWYYYDAAVILMDHVVSIHHDLRNGIANLSLIAMREKELRDLTSLKNYNPHLTIEDYDGHLRRIADLTSKAIRLATTDVHDETLVYPFMTIMMPVVMMADWIGNRDDMIHTFLEAIAPTIKHVASNGTVPTRAIIEVRDEAARGP